MFLHTLTISLQIPFGHLFSCSHPYKKLIIWITVHYTKKRGLLYLLLALLTKALALPFHRPNEQRRSPRDMYIAHEPITLIGSRRADIIHTPGHLPLLCFDDGSNLLDSG